MKILQAEYSRFRQIATETIRHGSYELHRKEKQIKCTALAVHENLFFFPMQFIWPVNTDKMLFNTYIYVF